MSKEITTVRCAHCAKEITVAEKDIRILNYCWECK
jgi:phage FluMu protein Com